MEKVLKELYEATVEGSVTSLLSLLQRASLILERCMVTSYGETPLHIAAMLGHVEFCLELLRRKPELAAEFDSRRSSPLHLASAKGYIDIVKALFSVKPEMCSACDREGNNPLHVAAMKGKVGVLKELVKAQPDAARARVGRGETILHLCVQYFQVDASRLLVEELKDLELLNARDGEGNTILHLAVADKQIEIIKYLLVTTSIDVNAQNSYELTPLDILARSRRDAKDLDIANCLQQAGAQRSKLEISLPRSGFGNHDVRETLPSSASKSRNSAKEWLNKQRDALMVVASLIATMAFQAVGAPPGGFWRDDKGHLAGTPIYADQNPFGYKIFLIYNTVSFISSLSIILLLISGLPFKRKVLMWILMVIMWISISSTAITYLISVSASTRKEGEAFSTIVRLAEITILGWVGLMALLVLVHIIRLILAAVRKVWRCLRGERTSTSTNLNSTSV